ncbi:MAG: heavy metal translocating P-type ATPase [Lentihominibacter sp.]
MKKYTVTGMGCAACSARVEKAVSAVQGVKTCSVNLLTNALTVEGNVSDEKILKAVREAGYDAAPDSGEEAEDNETAVLRKRLIASLVFWAVLMYFAMGHMMWNWPVPDIIADNHMASGALQLLLTGIIMVINRKFFTNGFSSMLHRAPNMDALVALGSGAAFVYSTVALIMGIHDYYFESAATILTLITLGKLLEAHSKGKTTNALKSLMGLAPKTATVIRDGRETAVPVEQVMKGDIFALRPGESIPVDGVVLEGNSAVDESALTGESIPRDKEPGSEVFSGTLNRSGYLRCEAARVGEDTTLAQIVRMVSDAASAKAPIAKAADRVAGIFVPVVIAIAAITIFVWIILGQTAGYSLARGISVLVISCPCALGLATPVAIMVGSGVGAKAGILFKTAEALEETGKVKIAALDKTGTITRGEPEITDIIPAEGNSREELLLTAYSLEIKSEHPLARAITKGAEHEGLTAEPVENFRILPGNGITANLNGRTLIGGSGRFISELIELSEEANRKADQLSREGKTPLFFARDRKLLGIIAVADAIKEDSFEAVRELNNMGIHVVMLTGDNRSTAEAVGGKVGVNEVVSEVLPDGKESAIRRLQKRGKVVMVGDGINDAPALTRADIGIAIGAGTDVAIDAADVVLMRNSLSDVPAAIRLSRAVLRNIHQNLFWAFIYNAIGIPLAAGLFIGVLGWQLNPMFAAAAMSLSSFCVVTNALRLNFIRLRDK